MSISGVTLHPTVYMYMYMYIVLPPQTLMVIGIWTRWNWRLCFGTRFGSVCVCVCGVLSSLSSLCVCVTID